MEGPSLFLAAEQLQPFVRRRIQSVAGNSRIGIERLHHQRVVRVFAWGKHLVIQCGAFALRAHFLLWGTFAATVDGASVTGDYRRSGPPRLILTFVNGEVTMWSASLRYLETRDARTLYDFTADVLHDQWDPKGALKKVRAQPDAEIADVLLDQSICAGVGNIIKNEVLFRMRTSPFARVRDIPLATLRRILADARVFSFRFLDLRREFQLRKHLEIYNHRVCVACQGKVWRKVHGTRGRRSFYCPNCQPGTPDGLRVSVS